MDSIFYHITASIVASFGIIYLVIRIAGAVKGKDREKEGYTKHKIIYFVLIIIILIEMVHEKVERIIAYYAG